MIAQYPPMGWNSWDCWGAAVNEETEFLSCHHCHRFLFQFIDIHI